MKITKFASKSCVKCKVLDNILKQAGVKDYTVLFSEDSEDEFKKNNVTTMPTLLFENEDKKEYLEGLVSPNQIKEVMNKIG